MTQPGSSTPPGQPPLRRRHSDIEPLAPSALVRLKDQPDVQPGVVVASDEWWDSLQIRGLEADSQVLVEWLRNGHPVRRWERMDHVEIVPRTPAPEAPEAQA